MYTIGRLNAAIYRNMQSLLGTRLEDLDIQSGQYDFFYSISLREGISQKELSEHLHIGKSTTAKAVKSLVSKGYVEKRKDERDARVDHLYLTPLGRSFSPLVASIFQENLSVAIQGLTEEEHAQLLALMERVLQNLLRENGIEKEAERHE